MSNVRIFIGSLAVAALTLAAAGCASGGGGNGGGTAYVRMDMGLATVADMSNQTRDVFRRMQFQVLREEPAPAPLVESDWRNQTPLEDERAAGITEVQARVIVRGRERPPQGNIRMYQVTYTMETMVKTAGSPDWVERPVTSQRRAMAREMGRELQTLLEIARR